MVVASPLTLTETVAVRTVGGQTVLVDTSQEKVTINSLPIKKVISVDGCSVFILDKLLIIKAKEFEKYTGVTE